MRKMVVARGVSHGNSTNVDDTARSVDDAADQCERDVKTICERVPIEPTRRGDDELVLLSAHDGDLGRTPETQGT